MSYNPAAPSGYDQHNDMSVAALMWALEQPERSERRRLLDGYTIRRVTLFDPWARTVDDLPSALDGMSAEAWIIRQYFGAGAELAEKVSA